MPRPAFALALILCSVPVRASGLDTSFGQDGMVLSPVEPDEQPRALVPWGDGVALVGRSWGATTAAMQVVRFTTAGDLVDVLTFSPGLASSGLRAGAVDPQGRLVVAGFAFADHGAGLATDAALLRLLPDGTLDGTFGEGGVVLLDIGGVDDEASAVLALEEGGVVAAGRTSLPVSNGVVPTRGALWRLDAEGAVTHQAVVTLHGEQDELVDVDRDGDGFVAVGTAVYDAGSRASVGVVRVDGALSLDAAYANHGVGLFDPGAFFAAVGVAVAVRDGRAFVGATIDNGAELPDYDLALLALRPDGRVDSTFGAHGVFAASVHSLRGLPEPSPDLLRALAFDRTGAPVLVGDSEGRPVLVRARVDGALDESFGDGGLLRVDPCGVTGMVADAVRQEASLLVAGACFRDPFFADAILLRFSLDDPAPIAAEDEGEGESAGEGEGEGEDEGEPGAESADGPGRTSGREGTGASPSCGCAAAGPTDALLIALGGGLLRARRRRPTENG